MEKEFKIPIAGTKLNIYGKQYGSFDQPVVISVHGLTGHMDEHLFYNAARHFNRQGISSVRFNLYGLEDDARNLVDCTLKTHAADLNSVIEYVSKQNPNKLFAIGHSYGGPTILLAEHTKLDAAVFWDASFDYRLNDSKELTGTEYRYLDWGVWSLIGRDMYREALEINQKEFFKDFHLPLKVITSGNIYNENRKQNYQLAQGPKDYHRVGGAGHTFSEEGKAGELFAETLKWLKQF